MNLTAAFLRRFMTKVRVTPTQCWEWRGATSKKRYDQRRPYVWLDGKAQNAARVMCAWINGPAPSSQHHAGHCCPAGENALCVSPFHLIWMTPQENHEHKQHRARTATHGVPRDGQRRAGEVETVLPGARPQAAPH